MAMIATCSAVSVMLPSRIVAPADCRYETLSGPAIASSTLDIMIPVASETITMPMSAVPFRWNGPYSSRFSRKESSAPQAAPASRPTQIDTPAWLSA